MKGRNIVCPHCGAANEVFGSGYKGTAAYSCHKCGEYFNLCGQALKPPSQWQEPIDEEY